MSDAPESSAGFLVPVLAPISHAHNINCVAVRRCGTGTHLPENSSLQCLHIL